MRDRDTPDYLDPRKEDIVYGDRRISRPDVSLPDWEVPDATYRPVPIVWFTAALMAQSILTTIVFFLTIEKNAYLSIALCVLSTVAIGTWTWRRGMAGAGKGWKVATILMLSGFLALYVSVARPNL